MTYCPSSSRRRRGRESTRNRGIARDGFNPANRGRIQASEQTLLKQRADQSQPSARQAIAVIVLANVASLSLLITGFAVLRRENARRAQAEYELLDVNQSRLGGSGIGKLDQHHTARPEGGLEQSGQGCGQLA